MYNLPVVLFGNRDGMDKKNTPKNQLSHDKKPSGSRLVKLAARTALIASIFANTPTYTQTLKTSLYLPWKNTIELVEKRDDSDHQKILHMNIQDILTHYGKKKWIEIIRYNFLEEINAKRNELGNTPLKAHPILNEIAQSKAQDMADNNYFDHTDKEGISDAGRMINDGRYDFSTFMSNISYNIKTIDGVIQSYINNNKRKTGHYDVIAVQGYEDLWVGFAVGKNGIWYIVVNFGKEIPKK